MKLVKVDSKGPMTIPVEIRRKLGIKPGTRILFEERGDTIVAHPLTPIHNEICKSKFCRVNQS